MKNPNPNPPETPHTHAKKLAAAKTYLIIFLVAIFTVINVITLVHNFKLHAENTQLAETARVATYAENCQIIGDFIPGLAPPLVRYQDELGIEQLYYCTSVTVDGPESIDKWNDEYWLIRKSGTEYGTEHYDLPDYDEVVSQTFYHTYDDYSNYSNCYTSKLETFSIFEANGFYYEIESKYMQIPEEVNIDDLDSIAAFLAKKDPPTATIYGIEILQPTPDQVDAVSYGDANVIPNDPSKNTCCGCTGCTCTDCKCTG